MYCMYMSHDTNVLLWQQRSIKVVGNGVHILCSSSICKGTELGSGGFLGVSPRGHKLRTKMECALVVGEGEHR